MQWSSFLLEFCNITTTWNSIKFKANTFLNSNTHWTEFLDHLLGGSINLFSHNNKFECVIVNTLLFLIILNTLFIYLSWWKYGAVISKKFIKQSTLKEIEELRLSVARLKLPKDYTPRI